MSSRPVIGRFAPSPTGDLHFGSLVTAVGSFLEAKSSRGTWLIRIEDLDPPREVQGSAERIINDLARLGMVSDQPVLYQSSRQDAYALAINQLLHEGRAFPCACSRKDLPDSGVYPGTCRNGIPSNKTPRSIRFRSDSSVNGFVDSVQGEITGEVDDFIIKRADGYFAYQLAVVVDDEFQHITEVVRGADLIDSTTRQIALQRALGLSTPRYLHLPIALSAEGKKLSKRHASDPVCNDNASEVIFRALCFLGQNPPRNLSLPALWAWALEHWDRHQIPREQHHPAN